MPIFNRFCYYVQGDLKCYANVGGRLPNWKFFLYAYFCLPGFRFVFIHRVNTLIASLPLGGRYIAKLLWARTCRRYSSEIAMSANIGAGCYMPHPYAIVLGDCTLGRNVAVLQCVTIGKRGNDLPQGPIIGDDVEIGAGATILGSITVGRGARIGANSVVLDDVPINTAVAGSPARIILGGTISKGQQ